MSAEPAPAGAGDPRTRGVHALHRRPWLRGLLLLSPPAVWFVALYLAALVALFVSAFWQVDDFTGKVVHVWTLDNFHTLVSEPTYRTIALRTAGIAAAVTVTDALVALPFAYYAARLAPKRLSSVLFVCVLLPLWVIYLVRVYAWRLILARDGILNWGLDQIGLGSVNVAYSKHGDVDRLQLHLAALHDPAGLGGDRARARLAAGGVGRHGRARLHHLPPRPAPARAARHRRRVDLHLLADARRLHHADARRRRGLGLHRQRRLPQRRRGERRPLRGRLRHGAGRRHGR